MTHIFALCESLHTFESSADFSFFQNHLFGKKSFRNIIQMSYSLDSDTAPRFVGSDMCVQTVRKGYQQTAQVAKELTFIL